MDEKNRHWGKKQRMGLLEKMNINGNESGSGVSAHVPILLAVTVYHPQIICTY